jgi:hypothetical protein
LEHHWTCSRRKPHVFHFRLSIPFNQGFSERRWWETYGCSTPCAWLAVGMLFVRLYFFFQSDILRYPEDYTANFTLPYSAQFSCYRLATNLPMSYSWEIL